MGTDGLSAAQSEPKLLARHGHLLLMMPPLMVVCLAQGLFDRTFVDAKLVDSVSHLISAEFENFNQQIVREGRARYVWLTTVVLTLVASVFAISYCGLIIIRAYGRQRRRVDLFLIIGLCAAGVACSAFSVVTGGASMKQVFDLTFRALEQSNELIAESFLRDIGLVLMIINALAFFAPFVAVFAGCCCLAPAPEGRRGDPVYVAERMKDLRGFLNAGSALLVAGILHMAAWLHWPASMVATDQARDGIRDLAMAISTYWGTTYSLGIVVIFIPAATILRARTVRLLKEEAAVQNPAQWMQEHGFVTSPAGHLRQLGVMFAPLLAAPLSQTLAQASGFSG